LRKLAFAVGVAAVLCASKARAVSLIAETTGGRGLLGLSLLTDIPLVEDRTYLTLCYAGSRGEGLPITHQFCAGVDHAINDQWIASGTVSLSPRSAVKFPITTSYPLITYQSTNSSLGANAVVAYNSDPLSPQQLGFDAGLAVTAYSLPHQWVFTTAAGRTVPYPVKSAFLLARPSLGALWVVNYATELSLRGAYYFYRGDDPATAGRISQAEIDAILSELRAPATSFGTALQTQLADATSEYLYNEAGGRILAADAVSGLAAAPLLFEIRPAIAHRFTSWLRGQLGYGFERYVPGQGYAHVLSTRWTVRPSDSFRFWSALALQLDFLPGSAPRPSGLLTVGAEYTF